MYRRSSRARQHDLSRSRQALTRPDLIDPPAENPRVHGDDDGVDYGDPRDARRERLDAAGPSPGLEKSGRALLVIQTYAVDGPRGLGVHHFEIWLAPEPDARPLVVLTRNTGSYQRALKIEGTPHRADITYHASRRPDGSFCFLLDTLREVS